MPTVTLAQLEDRVWDGLDDNRFFYPEENLRLVLNQGLARLNLLTGIFQDTIRVPGLTGNHLTYATPTGILVPLTLYADGVEMEKTSLCSLACNYRTWLTDSPRRYGKPARWAPVDLRTFVVHPIDTTGGVLLEMGGIIPATPLVEQIDEVYLDDQFVDILVDYSRFRAPLKEGGQPFATASQAHQNMIARVKTLTLWKGMPFPRYWILKKQDPQEQAVQA